MSKSTPINTDRLTYDSGGAAPDGELDFNAPTEFQDGFLDELLSELDGEPKPVLDLKEAREIALRRLDRKESSAKDLERYLQKKGISKPTASALVEEFVKAGWVSDERFSKMMVREQALRGKGPYVTRQKLREKGISMDLDQVRKLTQETTETSELEAAREIVRRKFPELLGEQSQRARNEALCNAVLGKESASDRAQSEDLHTEVLHIENLCDLAPDDKGVHNKAPDVRKTTQRALQTLLRRGFSYEVARELLEFSRKA